MRKNICYRKTIKKRMYLQFQNYLGTTSWKKENTDATREGLKGAILKKKFGCTVCIPVYSSSITYLCLKFENFSRLIHRRIDFVFDYICENLTNISSTLTGPRYAKSCGQKSLETAPLNCFSVMLEF